MIQQVYILSEPVFVPIIGLLQVKSLFPIAETTEFNFSHVRVFILAVMDSNAKILHMGLQAHTSTLTIQEALFLIKLDVFL